MNKSQQNVRDFMLGVGQSCPDKPTIPDEATRILRVKLLLEEVLEFAEASGVEIQARYEMEDFSKHHPEDMFVFEIMEGKEVDLIGVADGLSDINYVSNGAANAYGLDLEPFEEEVQRSNMSKLENGYRRDDGKWVKGPNYSPVNFEPILQKQANAS